MTASEPPTDATRSAQPAPAIGPAAARGLVWFFAQTVGLKVFSLVSQIIIAWLLGSEDYGYTGLAYMVVQFSAIIQRGGVSETLVQRGAEFRRWASPALRISLALGLCSYAILVAAAPLAARFFHDQRLLGLILVLGLQQPLNSVTTVAEASLAVHLRFRAIAIIQIICASVMMLLTIGFAVLEFGPYSFILPWVIVAALRLVLCWAVARPQVDWSRRWSGWQSMIGDNSLMLLTGFFITVAWQGDYLLLGRMYSKEVVGHYFWAFNLSTQALQVLTVNIASILFPSISKLQREPARQKAACYKAIRMLLLIGMPGCFLQAAVADPLIRLAFKPEWYPAIPLVQLLSIGFAFFAVYHAAISILKGQGRFSALATFTGVSAVIFLLLVFIGARAGAAIGVAAAVAAYAVFMGPVAVYLILRPMGGRWQETASMFAVPLALSVIACGAGWLIGRAIPGSKLVQAACTGAVACGLYAILFRACAADVWQDIDIRLRELMRRLT